jgi:DNA-binding PadR family transcriptional regulator
VLSDGTLYPLLTRLEREGKLEARWAMADGAKVPRKYYRLTGEGEALIGRCSACGMNSAPSSAARSRSPEMESALPSAAERYLDRLERALWALPSEERGAILLELRGHLAARAEAADEDDRGTGPARAPGAGFPRRRRGRRRPGGAPRYRVATAAQPPFRPQSGARHLAGEPEGLFTVGGVLLTALIASDWALFTLALNRARLCLRGP